MNKKLLLKVISISMVICSVILIFQFCSEPSNPFSDPSKVTVNLLLPDTTTTTMYKGDTVTLRIVTTYTALIDSVRLTVGTYYDSLFPTPLDTMTVRHALQDTGILALSATAYCNDGSTKESDKALHVYRNPLEPPDTLYTRVLSDQSIKLYWEAVAVASQYNVYRSDTGTYVLVQSVADTLCIDTGLTALTTYYYKVSSVDSSSNESYLSVSVSATTLPIQFAPVIVEEPESDSVLGGDTAIFYVQVNANPAPTFQWQADSVDITGATNDTLIIPNVPSSLNGVKYQVVVTNSIGSATSREAVLTVIETISKWDAMLWDVNVWE